MRYDIRTGVQQKKVNMKKVVVGGLASLATVGFMVVPAFAAGEGYGSQPGYPVANGNTICAGHGAFGAFSGTANDGQQGSAVHGYVLADKAAGVSLGSETGPANSNLCGNPQN